MKTDDLLSKIEKRVEATKAVINFDNNTEGLQMGKRRELKVLKDSSFPQIQSSFL